MIYYAKIGTQLCFTLEVPIRVCFRKRKKTFVIKSSAQQQPVLLRRAPLKLYTNDLLFMEKCTYQGRLQIQQHFWNISSVFKFSPQCLSLPYSSKTYCNRILLHISLVKNNVYTPGEKMPCYRGCCHLNRFTFV